VSIQPHVVVRRVVTSGTVNLKSSPCLDYERVERLTQESDPITEISILKPNLNSNKVAISRGNLSFSTVEHKSPDRDELCPTSIQMGGVRLNPKPDKEFR